MRHVLTALLLASAASSALAQPVSDQPFRFAEAPGEHIPASRDVPFPGVIALKIDATDVQRRIFTVEETIPVVEAGRMTLIFPQWLPGTHAPRGQLEKIIGLRFSANGRTLTWRRDSLNVFAMHVDVPAGAKTVTANFQFASATQGDQGRIVMTPNLISLQPNSLSLYPAGYHASRIPVDMQVKYPAGFDQAGALNTQKRGDVFVYERTDYDTLVDSPTIAGRYGRKEPLSDKVSLDIFADDPKYLAATPAQIDAHKRLVAEARAAFVNEPYDRYRFLLTLSDELGGNGLEHHRSSEDGVDTGYFLDWEKGAGRRNLLPHEYAHSWAGKYRRPVGLTTPEFHTPMQPDLLWAYEGLDQFWGYVLGGRSGLFTKQQTLDALAAIAAGLDASRGRDWRPVADTTFDPVISARRPKPWRSMQRSEDYYNEGMMTWLAADARIRKLTGGAKSMDDFAKLWFAGTSGDYKAKPFVYQDVVATLNRVVASDWNAFLQTHLYAPAPKLDLSGFTDNGYRLVFTPSQSAYLKASEGDNLDLAFSLGTASDRAGKITSVVWGSPAFQNGLTMGTEIIAVNGIAYSTAGLRAAVADAQRTRQPIRLTVRNGRYYRNAEIAYFDGLRYPSLEKIGQGDSGLDQLLAPKAR